MSLKKYLFGAAVLAFLLLLCASYANHFTNGFYFDDIHTIVNNIHIQKISNLPLFFTDIETFGTNPDNRTYNPVLVSLNAIDYWLGGGLNPVVFHLSIFLSYLILGVLLYYFFKHIFDISFKDRWNNWFALFTTAFFMQHTANAETINYIIMRSDSFSTLMIVASFILYLYPKTRVFRLHYLTFLVGLGTKETGLIFVPLLILYILLFEENMPLWGPLQIIKNFKKNAHLIKKSAPILFFGILVFSLIRKVTRQQSLLPTGDADTARSLLDLPSWHLDISWDYFVTQWYIIAHYIGNFIIPLDLSVDTDFSLITNYWDRKVWLSLGLILILLSIAVATSRKMKTRPISFGILWFFFALAPTSSFFAFGQLANDHRTFFPYLGLVLASGWWISLQIIRLREDETRRRITLPAVVISVLLLIGLHAYGTYQRNIIWETAESLWKDAVVKAPNNGRVQMNYGLALMEKGNYREAQKHFAKALEMMPRWSYAHINMAILQNATGRPKEAEQHFKNALRYHPLNPSCYYYYGRFLHERSRSEEALALVEKGMEISPNYSKFIELYHTLVLADKTSLDSLISYEKILDRNPQASTYLNLSLKYYKVGEYQRCITACRKALQLQPDYVPAYNNICSAYNAMSAWEKAEDACRTALKINPDYQLAKNNLQVALSRKQ
ncbi:tetratricopeptide repeat protein [Desulfogranum japonicum]|uniref:tetratricopeptide repeat protein n=1 Tax=Desulfogranum japonicum TaxID=231447 RepID=UPI00040A8C38|nr:tetratricopeptide repeat protein [Desulfogranum japonicum]